MPGRAVSVWMTMAGHAKRCRVPFQHPSVTTSRRKPRIFAPRWSRLSDERIRPRWPKSRVQCELIDAGLTFATHLCQVKSPPSGQRSLDSSA